MQAATSAAFLNASAPVKNDWPEIRTTIRAPVAVNSRVAVSETEMRFTVSIQSRCELRHITSPFTGPRRTVLISELARPAAPCATVCYAARSYAQRLFLLGPEFLKLVPRHCGICEHVFQDACNKDLQLPKQ